MEPTLATLIEKGLGRAATVAKQHSAEHVIRAMVRDHVNIALVRDDDQKIVGIITERDLVHRVLAFGRRPSAVLAAAIMTAPVHFVSPNMPVSEALEMLKNQDVRRLIVAHEGMNHGALSRRELWMWVAHDLEHQVGDLTDYICGRTSSVPPPLLPVDDHRGRESAQESWVSSLPL